MIDSFSFIYHDTKNFKNSLNKPLLAFHDQHAFEHNATHNAKADKLFPEDIDRWIELVDTGYYII